MKNTTYYHVNIILDGTSALTIFYGINDTTTLVISNLL